MNILDILYTTLIMPLQLMFEVLYMLGYRMIGDAGLSIIVLSLMMNFLILPLYMRADKMQEDERDMEARLREGVRHIRTTFKGDEKMMMLNAYYRQNNYKPTDVIKGSISLFLEIPFFISAYMFLSHLELIKGVSFGVIADLGAPDGSLHIAGLTINVLPFVMTGINLISCIIFTKGMPAKTKIQLYGMALFFLVFLYNSPAGLVFYWTLNNLFALVKTIFYKLPNPKRTLVVLFACVGVGLLVFDVVGYTSANLKKQVLLGAIGALCLAPLGILGIQRAVARWQNRSRTKRTTTGCTTSATSSTSNPRRNTRIFIACALFLTVLTGVLIPSAVISASPLEFMDPTVYTNPLWYIVSSFCLAVGTFCVWMSVFYWLCAPRFKSLFTTALVIICVISVVNYLFFGTNLGLIDNTLTYENDVKFPFTLQLINLGILGIIGLFCVGIHRKFPRLVTSVVSVACVAIIAMSTLNLSTIYGTVSNGTEQIHQIQENKPQVTLSKTGQNVIVIMLDRGMNHYFPYILDELPQLKDQFKGFTFYPNTTSFGGTTNIGSPALFGGYEYTPVELNKRNTEHMMDKHNEALKVMPVMFSQAGFDVTVFDPTYANYKIRPDLSIYNDYPEIKKYITLGAFSSESDSRAQRILSMRNFFCFSVVKSSPLFAQPTLYNNGCYNSAGVAGSMISSVQMTADNGLKARGVQKRFYDAYNALVNLPQITLVSDEVNSSATSAQTTYPDSHTFSSDLTQNQSDITNPGSFLLMTNDTTHEPIILQEPDFAPALNVDNTAYEAARATRSVSGRPLFMDSADDYALYQVNAAALIQLGNWLDYLRDEGVYDNTRIIITADHGRFEDQSRDRYLTPLPGHEPQDPVENLYYYTNFYYPIMLVKDFNAQKLTTSDEFMTNADTPTLATQGVIKNPTNPFTAKAITDAPKFAGPQYVLGSLAWDAEQNNGTTFLPGVWFSVQDDVRDISNWKQVPDPLGPGGALVN